MDLAPGISVVVCSRDRPEQLDRALAALVPALRPRDEAVVVDSASRDGATLALAERHRVRAVRCERPGLARARNAGVAATSRSLVAFTDDDCLALLGWLDALESALADPAVGMVTGAVLPLGPTGPIPTSTGRSTQPRRHVRTVEVSRVGHGANMAVRRALLGELGGFDELLGAGAPLRSADDWDLFLRVLRAGHEIAYVPAAAVAHEQWRSDREALRTRYGYALGAGALGVKALRLSDPGGRRLLADRIVHQGASRALRAAARGRWWPFATAAADLAGGVVGALRAARLPLDGTRFAEVRA